MPGPIFTPEQIAEWEQKEKDAARPRPSDEISRSGYNLSASKRLEQVRKARRWAWLEEIEKRPDELVNLYLVALAERAREPVPIDDLFEGRLEDRVREADTPENRRVLHTILQGLKAIPRSWGRSAAVRYFRGIGKQAQEPWASKPGAGLLSPKYGWKVRDTENFVHPFYSYAYSDYPSLGDLFFTDDSGEPYGEKFGEVYEAGGNPWAATRNERNTDFIDKMLTILEARGLADSLPDPMEKKPKPRKPKVWKAGDKITSRNLRDLPKGAHIRWSFAEYPFGSLAKTEVWEATIFTREMVLEHREPGKLLVHPIVDGHALGPLTIRSSSLYRDDYLLREAQAVYLGQWEGEILDVEITWEAWRPVVTKVKRITQTSPTGPIVKPVE